MEENPKRRVSFNIKRLLVATTFGVLTIVFAVKMPPRPLDFSDDAMPFGVMMLRDCYGRLASASLGAACGSLFGKYWWILGIVLGLVFVPQLLSALIGRPDWP